MNPGAPRSDAWPGSVRLADVSDLEALLPLFEGYRAFYKASRDDARARQFLLERFRFNQSTIFLAEHPARRAVGFAQLYPLFTSVGLAQVLLLNDLFVAEEHRDKGAAELLLSKVREHAQHCGAAKLRLVTAVDNHGAQRLYERAGWQRNDAFLTYELPLPTKSA